MSTREVDVASPVICEAQLLLCTIRYMAPRLLQFQEKISFSRLYGESTIPWRMDIDPEPIRARII